MAFTLEMLEMIIAERAKASVETSWTAKLLHAGPARIAKKFGEEAVEAIIAAAQGNRQELTLEAADVLYHLLVLLRGTNIPLAEVLAELERRTAQSGIAEKQARQ